MTLQINSFLKSRYRIEDIISKGGMGAIYSAYDESLSVKVAVKENLFTTDDSTRQFRREATILASLRHPNLPRVTDHFVIPDQGQYLVMDFIEGEDLKDRIARQVTLPEEEVALIGIAICDALLHMHTRKPPIVHRDIKPGNIKTTPNGESYLVDFGIAKISQPGQGTTVGAQSLTPGFAPPEQYGQGTDPRTDIYSLGATLYMALTGVIPANGLSRLMKQEELRPIREINPRISKELAAVIEKSLEVRKEDRYQSSEEFLQALLNAHRGAREKKNISGTAHIDPAPTVIGTHSTKRPVPAPAVEAGLSNTSIPVKKSSSRKLLLWAAIGGILSIMAIIIILSIFVFDLIPIRNIASKPQSTPSQAISIPSDTSLPPASTDTPEPTGTIFVAQEASPSPENTATEENTPEATFTPQNTPTGGGSGQIVFVSDRAGNPQLYLMNSNGSNVQQITNEMDGACQPDWSPDGKRIVFVSPCRPASIINPQNETYRGSTLFIINADGTGRIPLASFPGGDFDPAWSPDGKTIAFTTYRDNLSNTDLNLYLFNLEDNSVTALTRDLNIDRRPAWSPDGQYIAFQRQAQGANIQINILSINDSSIYIFSDPTLTNTFMPDWSISDTIVFSRGNPFPQAIARPLSPRNAQEIKLSDDSTWDMDFSPDGYWLAFERVVFLADGSRNHDLFLMSSVGGSAIQLTDDPARDYQPAWKP